jgi:AAHS family 4-hydroxybenzoate transporter-like MFS transporter
MGEAAIPITGRARVAAVILCFLTILLDGYDTGVVSFTAPTLAHDWGLPPAAFTPAFVATSLGAVIGYLSCGALSERFGHRRVVTVSTAFFALMSLLTLLASGITSLTVLRFVTALGLGGAIPTAIALGASYGEGRQRELLATIVTLGIIFGTTLGGLVAVPLLRRWGWTAPYVLGALAPGLLVLAQLVWLPDAPVRHARGSAVAELFRGGLAAPTLLLWLMVFLSFMQSYSFGYWMPLLLTSFGFDKASAALGSTYTGAGAIAGVLLMMLGVKLVGSPRYLAGAFAVGALLVLFLAYGGLSNGAVPWLLVLSSAGLGIGGVGQAAIGAMLYPGPMRTTGIGWSSAMGRIGSIFGPAIAGGFLSLHWAARDIIALAAVPAFAASAIAAVIYVLVERRRPQGAANHV